MTTRTNTGVAALTLAGALLAVGGCGGSQGLSRNQLIAKADAICRRANHALDSSKISPGNFAQVAPGVAATEHQASTELAKLTPPSSMASDWKVIVDGFRRTGTGLETIGQVAKSLPLKALPQSKTLIEAESEVNSGQHDRAVTAARNGFNDCAKY